MTLLDRSRNRDNFADSMSSSAASREKAAAAVEILKNEEAYGAALVLAALQFLSLDELLSFDPETVKLELQDASGIPLLDPDNFSRLMAALAVIGTDLFYTNLPAFIDICNLLSGQAADPDVFDPADPYEMAWAIAETELLDKFDGDDEHVFSLEIRSYMGQMLYEHGFLSPPARLSYAIMPDNIATPADLSGEEDMLSAIVATDIARHDEIDAMIANNIAGLANQLRPLMDLHASADKAKVDRRR